MAGFFSWEFEDSYSNVLGYLEIRFSVYKYNNFSKNML